MPLDPYRKSDFQRVGLEEFLRVSKDPVRRGKLASEIAEAVNVVAKKTGRSSVLRTFGDDLKSYIWLDPPDTASDVGVISRAYLIGEGRKVIRFQDEMAVSKPWADAYILPRDTGYVFAPRELSPLVYLACQKIVRERFNVRIPKSMEEQAKQDPAELSSLREALHQAGYYNASPHDLRPPPKTFTRGGVPGLIKEVLTNCRGYMGPEADPTSVGGPGLTDERIRDWLRQFEDDAFVDAALRVLRACRLIGRTELTASLVSFIEEHPEFRGANICPLGTAKDSSSILAYYAADVAGPLELKVRGHLEALSEPDVPIVFVDDFIGSGHQAISIIEGWLGEDLSFDLDEGRETPLHPQLHDALRSRPLGFSFSAGSRAGVQTLKDRLAELGLNTTKIEVGVNDSELPNAHSDNIYASANQKRTFLRRCREIGASLLVDPEEHHDAAWAEERTLGYGNDAYLVLFPYNTPAQTLTCLWKAGTVDGIPWSPVFPRRKKT